MKKTANDFFSCAIVEDSAQPGPEAADGWLEMLEVAGESQKAGTEIGILEKYVKPGSAGGDTTTCSRGAMFFGVVRFFLSTPKTKTWALSDSRHTSLESHPEPTL